MTAVEAGQGKFSAEERGRNRAAMPRTAAWVEERRREWGAGYVNALLRRACSEAVPDLFYALEAGRTLGTPFTAACDPVLVDWQRLAVIVGAEFAAFMAAPEGGVRGSD